MGYIPYVNTKQGSKMSPRFSQGNTLPLTQMPFGMSSFCPQNLWGHGWFYISDERHLYGLRLTHQPSIWLGDYGTLLFMPQREMPRSSADLASSSFRPEEAVLDPDYLKLELLRHRTTLELTPTERGASLRLRYDGEKKPFFSIFGIQGTTHLRIDAANNRVIGWTDGHSALDIAEDFRMHFVLQFTEGSINAAESFVTNPGNQLTAGTQTEGVGTALHLALNDFSVQAQLAISYVREEQALRNWEQELTGRSFDELRAAANAKWEDCLSRIEITTPDEDRMRTFYSCMYRVFLYPHKCYEWDADGNPIHYCPHDGGIRPGYRYTDNGFWDTYRTVYPLFSLIAKDELPEMLDGFIQDFRDGGWLPRWTTLGGVNCMPSSLIDAVIADAAVKNVLSRDVLETALQGMIKHATEESPDPRFGRLGVSSFKDLGYVAYEAANPCVNLTLDFAYGDFCIAEVAKVLGHTDIEEKFRATTKNYRLLFDPSTGLMRARDGKGNMIEPFDPFAWGGAYCEGSAYQSSFAVPHDPEGLAELYGGKEKLLEKMDEVFRTPPYFTIGEYPYEIHEMTEMASVDFGQCAMCNQPSFHLPFFFAVLGDQAKTDYWVERICNELFSWRDFDGFPGDEDNGTTAAWYIFACLGLYPFCPGKPEYIKCKMLVDTAKINGKPWDNRRFGTVIPHGEI